MFNESNDGMWIDWKQDRSQYIDWSLQMSNIIEYIWWIWIFHSMWYWCIYWISWLFQWFIIFLWLKCCSLFNWNIEIEKRMIDIIDESDESKETELWFHSEEGILSIFIISSNSIYIWIYESIDWLTSYIGDRRRKYLV